MSPKPLAGIIGGLLAGITLRTPYFAQIFVAFIALPAAITLVEPTRKVPLIKAGIRRDRAYCQVCPLYGSPTSTKYSVQRHNRNRHPDHGLVCPALL